MKSYTMNPSKRQKRNEQINYSRIISAIEALVAKKYATLQAGGEYYTMMRIAEDVKFWKGRIEALREKQLSE